MTPTQAITKLKSLIENEQSFLDKDTEKAVKYAIMVLGFMSAQLKRP